MTRRSWLFVPLVSVLGSATPVAADPPPSSGPVSIAPEIAPPEPDAPPEKVREAEKVADKAKLTPIVPSPNNPTRPAFQLYAEIDPPIVATGVVFALARLVKTQPAFCGQDGTNCAVSSLNPIDRTTAGYYSQSWARVSDVGLYGLGVAGAALLVSDEGLLPALNDAVVVGEATLSATAVASVMTLAAGRPRPFLYGNNAPDSVRTSADASLSFLSSHTAEAFAIATSLFVAEHRLHPDSGRNKWILGIGLGVASTVAAARVMSGYHFITDVVGGAVVGSSMGVLVSSVHGSPVHVVPVVNHEPSGHATGGGLGLSGNF